MRLFTAVDLPGEILDKLEALLARLRPLAQIHWSPVSNLHITTKFIGEWPEDRLGELTAVLAGLRRRDPIPIDVMGLAFIPSPRAPRIFHVCIRSETLPALAADTADAVAALGVEPEKREYSAHLTLARNRERAGLATLQEAIAGLGSLDFGSFEARSFFLYRSRMKPGGSVYTRLAEFPLSRS